MKTFITQPRSLSLGSSRKERKKKKKSPLRCQFCFASPQANPVSGYKDQSPAEGKVLDLILFLALTVTLRDLIPAASSALPCPQPHPGSELPPSPYCSPVCKARKILQSLKPKPSLGATSANQPKRISGNEPQKAGFLYFWREKSKTDH